MVPLNYRYFQYPMNLCDGNQLEVSLVLPNAATKQSTTAGLSDTEMKGNESG